MLPYKDSPRVYDKTLPSQWHWQMHLSEIEPEK
jgi:hypothetical protein